MERLAEEFTRNQNGRSKKMKTILKYLWVIQTRQGEEMHLTKRIDGTSVIVHRVYKRVNPFNPLSYVVLFSVIPVAIVMFGVVGAWKEIDFSNPFVWR
jgi:hypothetical protein